MTTRASLGLNPTTGLQQASVGADKARTESRRSGASMTPSGAVRLPSGLKNQTYSCPHFQSGRLGAFGSQTKRSVPKFMGMTLFMHQLTLDGGR